MKTTHSLRSHTCNELRKDDIGSKVTICGRADNIRDMGGLFFLDIRDRYGIIQINGSEFDDKELLKSIKFEYCLQITGTVQARPEGQTNDSMDTGEIELIISEIKILNTCKELPFPIREDHGSSEEIRFQYRFLDLRRRSVLENIKFRARMNHFTINWFTQAGFLEVQTPLLSNSSPEGARDFLVPSRIHQGKFFALPQAPQQFKQLLMMGGIDKYFQIAPCFRDEDPRADRHTGAFYQVDLEMSYVQQDDVLDVLKGYGLAVAKSLTPHKNIVYGDEVPVLTYKESMDKYGIDRPDLRIPGMEIKDLSEELASSGFGVFSGAIKDGGHVRAIKLEGKSMTRKEIDQMTAIAKNAGAGGLAYLIFENGEVRSPIAKFLTEQEILTIQNKLEAKDGDMIFFAAGNRHLVCKVLNKIRMAIRDKYDLVDKNDLAFCFIVDFPFYEYDEANDKRDFGHNPFSHVVGGLAGLDVESLHDVETNQYDFVLNGFELGSGSIRNHDPEVMIAAFEKVGLSEEDVKTKFGAMYEAFQYGCPPHGGFAFGFDRLMMILCDEPNIREVYAFPKSSKAEDLLMRAPGTVDSSLLEELAIETTISEEE